jgi:hypothetical protein
MCSREGIHVVYFWVSQFNKKMDVDGENEFHRFEMCLSVQQKSEVVREKGIPCCLFWVSRFNKNPKWFERREFHVVYFGSLCSIKSKVDLERREFHVVYFGSLGSIKSKVYLDELERREFHVVYFGSLGSTKIRSGSREGIKSFYLCVSRFK